MPTCTDLSALSSGDSAVEARANRTDTGSPLLDADFAGTKAVIASLAGGLVRTDSRIAAATPMVDASRPAYPPGWLAYPEQARLSGDGSAPPTIMTEQ